MSLRTVLPSIAAAIGRIVAAGVAASALIGAVAVTTPPTEEVTVSRGDTPRPLASVLPEGPVILHFWATWCAPCREELPALARFADDLRQTGDGERLVLVSVDSLPYARVAGFLADELGLAGIASWVDAGRRAGAAFGIGGYPATLLLDGARREAGRTPGPVDWDDPDARRAMIAFLDGETAPGDGR